MIVLRLFKWKDMRDGKKNPYVQKKNPLAAINDTEDSVIHMLYRR